MPTSKKHSILKISCQYSIERLAKVLGTQNHKMWSSTSVTDLQLLHILHHPSLSLWGSMPDIIKSCDYHVMHNNNYYAYQELKFSIRILLECQFSVWYGLFQKSIEISQHLEGKQEHTCSTAHSVLSPPLTGPMFLMNFIPSSAMVLHWRREPSRICEDHHIHESL